MKRFLLLVCVFARGTLVFAQSAPPLASAQSFAVLGATTVTNAGPTVVAGDLGVSPGTAITGFPPGSVSGGTIHAGDATSVSAQQDAHTAYAALVSELCQTNLSGQILGTSPAAVTLSPGVYCFNSLTKHKISTSGRVGHCSKVSRHGAERESCMSTPTNPRTLLIDVTSQ